MLLPFKLKIYGDLQMCEIPAKVYIQQHIAELEAHFEQELTDVHEVLRWLGEENQASDIVSPNPVRRAGYSPPSALPSIQCRYVSGAPNGVRRYTHQPKVLGVQYADSHY